MPQTKSEVPDSERALRRTFDRAVNLLTYKPRSVRELRERLLEKDWTDETVVDRVIEKLEYYGYLNDGQFAKSFAASQIRQKPVGKRLLEQKLRQKKLDKETIDEAIEKTLEEVSEEELIDLAIAKRIRLKGRPESREDAKKFYDHLLRQGFSYELVGSKMRKIAARDVEEE